jgi:heat shock protein HtpX
MTNNIRTLLLMVSLTILFVWLGNLFAGRQGMIIAFLLATAMNFFAYWFSDKMVLRRYNATEIESQSHPALYQSVARLAAEAQLPMPKVYIIPGKTPNAFATGRNPQHAAVAVTEGILEILDDRELAGVLAHELAHVKHRDILTGTIAATFAGAITILAQFARYRSQNSQKGQNPLGSLLILIGAPLIAMVIRMAVSRVREYAADKEGAQISVEPLGLANALHKLQHGVQRYTLSNGNPAHSHMFIVNPFLGGVKRLFSTHPPTEERIRRLELIATEMDISLLDKTKEE